MIMAVDYIAGYDRRPMAGYSGTPLVKKLGIKAGTRIFTESAFSGYPKLLGPLPADAMFVPRLTADTDIIHLFVTKKSDLAKALKSLRVRIRDEAAIWVSWPKKASRMPTDITEDTIRAVALPLGFVDVKVCAVDEVWSGLKLVIRKEQRKQRLKL
jgi:hypothetical protein